MAFTTLVDALHWRGLNQPAQQAFTFLIDGDVDRSAQLTYGELHEQALRIAKLIRSAAASKQQPVLLLFPPGLEVIAALFGCFYAESIAIVADSPQRRSSLSAVESMIDDAGVTLGLVSSRNDIEHHLAHSVKLNQIHWLAVDEMGAFPLPASDTPPYASPESIALLQYTSGSTGTPKGVMVNHANIIDNSAAIQQHFRQNESSRSVYWLPLSHDMGLVGGVFQPVYTGYTATFMPPLSFLQRPVLWLEAISTLRATTTAAPDFAYELCVRKVRPEQREKLDLSAWAVAINGSEPVQAQTIVGFTEFFAPCRFRREAFYPAYGLAEATLVVSAGKTSPVPVIRQLPDTSTGESPFLVGCGHISQNHKVVIADPALGVTCNSGEVGEIWVAGDSVAKGYWNRTEESAATFDAYLSDTGEGPFLRTGDLGCLLEDELFVSGRLKDVIIVRGVNYSPYAIEQTVENCHRALRPSCSAAFMVHNGREECLVIASEVERNFLRTLPVQEICDQIRSAVGEEHGLDVKGVALLRPASLPKTPTGKTKRQSCRQAYLDGSLNVISRWPEALRDSSAQKADVAPQSLSEIRHVQELRVWLLQRLSQHLAVPANEIDPKRPFAEYGLDSAAVVGLAGELEDYLGCEFMPTLIYDYPTVDALCLYFAENPLSEEAARPAGA